MFIACLNMHLHIHTHWLNGHFTPLVSSLCILLRRPKLLMFSLTHCYHIFFVCFLSASPAFIIVQGLIQFVPFVCSTYLSHLGIFLVTRFNLSYAFILVLHMSSTHICMIMLISVLSNIASCSAFISYISPPLHETTPCMLCGMQQLS